MIIVFIARINYIYKYIEYKELNNVNININNAFYINKYI